jgi:hypothetical protein
MTETTATAALRAEAPPRPKRMTLSEVVERLLARGGSDRSTVTLTRNAKGEVQIDVSVRTGDEGDIVTLEDAERAAQQVYDRLAAAYPLSATHETAGVELTRNAKGETQISVDVKTSEALPTLAEAAEKAQAEYDKVRRQYPHSDRIAEAQSRARIKA